MASQGWVPKNQRPFRSCQTTFLTKRMVYIAQSGKHRMREDYSGGW